MKLLSENKRLLENMARLLIEKETIYQDEVDMIMAGKDVKEIIEYMETNEENRRANPFKRSEKREAVGAASAADKADGDETKPEAEVVGAGQHEETEQANGVPEMPVAGPDDGESGDGGEDNA